MRTFVAIELPVPFRPIIEKHQQQIGEMLRAKGQDRSVRWTPADKAHLTVRFLGNTSPEQQAQICEGMSRLSLSWRPLTLRLDGIGCFPGFRQPRVIWLGIDDATDRLAALQSQIETLAQAAGFEPERRGFSPHLTIGRVARGADRASLQQVGEAVRVYAAELEGLSAAEHVVAAEREVDSAFVVDHLVHFESQLKPSGAIYTPLAVFVLGSASGG